MTWLQRREESARADRVMYPAPADIVIYRNREYLARQ